MDRNGYGGKNPRSEVQDADKAGCCVGGMTEQAFEAYGRRSHWPPG